MANVLVAVPTNDRKNYCREDFREGLDYLVSETAKYHDVDVVISDDTVVDDEVKDYWMESGYKVIKIGEPENISDVNEYRTRARNKLREYFLADKKYTHIFWLDSDIIPSEDIVIGLLKHEVDVVSGVYYQKIQGNVVPLVFGHQIPPIKVDDIGVDEPIPNRHITYSELIPSRLMNVICAPFGNTLMTRKVMEDVSFRWYGLGDESVVWFFDALKKGYNIFVDSHFQSKHYWETI